jgi:hypothetical protein
MWNSIKVGFGVAVGWVLGKSFVHVASKHVVEFLDKVEQKLKA